MTDIPARKRNQLAAILLNEQKGSGGAAPVSPNQPPAYMQPFMGAHNEPYKLPPFSPPEVAAQTSMPPLFTGSNPYPESGTPMPAPPPPPVQAALAPPSMPLVPPGALPPAQPQGLDPATFPSTSSIDQKITPNLGSGDMLEQWRRMMDQAQWARQGG